MNGTPSWRASASPIWSSERYPLSISTRPSFRPERPWSSSAPLSCSCEMSFCCRSRSPSRMRSGRLVLIASATILLSVTARGDFRWLSRATLPLSRRGRKRPLRLGLTELSARGGKQAGEAFRPGSRDRFQVGQPYPGPFRVDPHRGAQHAGRFAVAVRKREQHDLAIDHRGRGIDSHRLGIECEFVLQVSFV